MNLDKKLVKRLDAVVKHAYCSVPYYRFFYQQSWGLCPEIRDLNSFLKLPLLTRNHLVSYYNLLVAIGTDVKKCRRIRTSGTTGQRASVLLGPERLLGAEKWIIKRLHYYGVSNPRTWRIAYISIQQKPDIPYAIEGAATGFSETLTLYPFSPEWESIESLMRFLSNFNPDLIISYPSIFQYILLKCNFCNKHVHPNLIFSVGEVLTEGWREKISGFFRTDIFDIYGSTEVGINIFECKEHRGYHYDTEEWYVELLPSLKENYSTNSNNEIIITSLQFKTMPFIRYCTGDFADSCTKTCNCGVSGVTLSALAGRHMDCLNINGKIIRPLEVQRGLDVEGVLDFQVRQNSCEDITIFYYTDSDHEKVGKRIIDSARAIFGKECRVNIESVDAGISGHMAKSRPIVSSMVY